VTVSVGSIVDARNGLRIDGYGVRSEPVKSLVDDADTEVRHSVDWRTVIVQRWTRNSVAVIEGISLRERARSDQSVLTPPLDAIGWLARPPYDGTGVHRKL